MVNIFIVLIWTSVYVLIPSALNFDVINEKMSGFKLTQYNLGINDVSYWLSFYITHWVYIFIKDILFDFNFFMFWDNLLNADFWTFT